MVAIEGARLQAFITNVLRAVNVAGEIATVVAEGLVFANRRGVDSHGVIRLPIYVRRIREGLVNADPQLSLDRTGPGTGILDGDNGPGIAVGRRAMTEAVMLASEAGTGIVVCRNSNHFGAAAFMALAAIEQGMIGIATTHAEADVVPFGGAAPALGTNPLAIAVPGREHPPLVLDMATSGVAMGRVLKAASEGQSIPEGWAVDAEGRGTTDASRARAVLPMAGPKGYGLAVMIDVLTGLLSGGPVGTDIPRMYDDFSQPQRLGHLIMAIDIARFTDVETFRTRVDAMADALHGVPAADGSEGVAMPGEPEHRMALQRDRDGIPIGDELRTELNALADDLSVEKLS